MTRIYLDTNFFIRYVESADTHLVAFVSEAEVQSWELFTSELTLAETLVLPLRIGDDQLIQIYEAMLVSDNFLTVLPIDRAILRTTAQVRASIGNQPADAIHIATAISTSCSGFLSSDARLRLPAEIRRVDLESAATIGNHT